MQRLTANMSNKQCQTKPQVALRKANNPEITDAGPRRGHWLYDFGFSLLQYSSKCVVQVSVMSLL